MTKEENEEASRIGEDFIRFVTYNAVKHGLDYSVEIPSDIDSLINAVAIAIVRARE